MKCNKELIVNPDQYIPVDRLKLSKPTSIGSMRSTSSPIMYREMTIRTPSANGEWLSMIERSRQYEIRWDDHI